MDLPVAIRFGVNLTARDPFYQFKPAAALLSPLLGDIGTVYLLAELLSSTAVPPPRTPRPSSRSSRSSTAPSTRSATASSGPSMAARRSSKLG